MTEKTSPEKRKIQRSAAYPGISLEKAIEATRQLRDNLGSGPYSRDSAATALGYSSVSGASVTKVSACVHFGLLTRTGNAYSQSALADQIFRYVTEEERISATRTAALKPTLYAKLVGEFNGRALPNMLDNLLVRNYGITERVAKDVANTFIKSIQYAGILKNGIIIENSSDTDPLASEDAYGQEPQQEDTQAGSPLPELSNHTSGKQSPAASDPNYLTINIPDTDVKIVFPMSYAYDLSIGTFKEGIEALSRSIKKESPDAGSSDEPTATA